MSQYNVDVLLDTHVLIWLALNDSRGVRLVDALLDDDSSTISVSSISWMEIAIKRSLGKLQIDLNGTRARALELGFLDLTTTGNHAEQLALLPLHHRDPFDRMLIAQSISEEMQIVTADPAFSAYDEARIYQPV